MNILLYITVILSFLLLLAALEITKRKFKINTELTRKSGHIGIGLLVIFWIQYLTFPEFFTITCLFFIIFIVFYYYKLPLSIYLFSRKTYGEIAYIVGIGLLGLSLYEDKNKLILGMLLLIFPDSISGLYNFHWKKNEKNTVHAIVYFIVSCILSSFYVSYPAALFISLFLTGVEFYSSRGSDNVTVPLAYILLIRFF